MVSKTRRGYWSFVYFFSSIISIFTFFNALPISSIAKVAGVLAGTMMVLLAVMILEEAVEINDRLKGQQEDAPSAKATP
jgi:hypothetical protein